MIALVSGASATLRRYATTGHFGRLIVPGAGNLPDDDPPLPWAADNGAFTGFDEDKFLRMLERVAPHAASCRFVAAPDVVGDAYRTQLLYEEWAEVIAGHGLPVAFIAQDGLRADRGDAAPLDVPWGACDAVFIGGSTEFKLGAVARDVMREAHRRGKWVHVGRVNTPPRVRYLQTLEGAVDSIDGTTLSAWPDVWFPAFVNLLGKPQLYLEVDA